MSATEETPRRLTPTERLHDLAARAMERPQAAAVKPSFDVSSTKAGAEEAKSGVFERIEWSAHVPVCDEFPTAEEAFEASKRYARGYREEFGENGAKP